MTFAADGTYHVGRDRLFLSAYLPVGATDGVVSKWRRTRELIVDGEPLEA